MRQWRGVGWGWHGSGWCLGIARQCSDFLPDLFFSDKRATVRRGLSALLPQESDTYECAK